MSVTPRIWKIMAVVGLASGAAFGTATAAEHGTHAHHRSAEAGKLVLNKGQKWATDEALRKGMEAIRGQMAAVLHDIHAGKLSAAGYNALATGLGTEVGGIVAHCKLEPQADAQIHLVIADVLAGVDAMQGKVKHTARKQGAVRVLGALDQYATYFDHPHWQPIQE